MRIEFKHSFDRSIKALNSDDKEEIKNITIGLIDILSMDRPLHEGLGLKRLRGPYWEVRKGLKARILFRWQRDLVEFVLAGDHEDIKRFLKSV
jgi:mRNA-degrading endonuclease YafQ of YafQ-DinJ toxin-antitoxin module